MGFLKGFLRKAEEEIADILPGGKTGKSIRAQRKAPVAKTVSRPRDESKSWLSKDFNPVSDGINDIKSAFKYASKDWKSSENQRQVDTQNANRQILKKYTQGQLNKNQVESLVGSKVKNAGLKKKGNLYVNTVKNSTGETLLQNTGAGIMNAAPQRVIGGLAEYGGTALGNDSIRDFGTRLNQPFRDYNALAYENADNKAVAIGGNIAGNLLTLPIAPAGKAGLAYRGVVAGAPTAADTGYAIKQAGGGRVAQTIGGGATGIASGYLNSVGGDKILKPVGAVTSKLVGKTVTTKLAPTAFGRIGAGVLNEGGEEVIEQGVDNAVAKSTYDPDRKLTDNLATSFLLGGAMGGVVRGGVELGNPNTRTQLINESKVKDIANDRRGILAGPLAGDFSRAKAQGKVFEGVDGKPRFEVDDSGAKLNNVFDSANRVTDLEQQYGILELSRRAGNTSPEAEARLKTLPQEIRDAKRNARGSGSKKLSDVLDHPKLYEQYPQLADAKVKLYTSKTLGEFGRFNRKTGTIELNKTTLADSPQEAKAQLLHELTHNIQEIEGFAKGSDTSKGMDNYNRSAGEAEARAVANRMNMTEGERYKNGSSIDSTELKTNGQTKVSNGNSQALLKQETVNAGGKEYDAYEISAITSTKAKTGSATKLLNDIKELANTEGKLLVLQDRASARGDYKGVPNSMKPEAPMSQSKLTKWYEKNGFKRMPMPDGSPSEVMYYLGKPSKSKPQSTFNDSLDVPKEDLIIRDGSGKAMSVEPKADPLESLKQEAKKYKSAEEFVKANAQAPMTSGKTYMSGKNKDIAAGSVIKTTLNDAEYVVQSSSPDGLMVQRKALIDAGISPDEMPSPMRINPNEVVDVPTKVSGDVRTLRDKLYDAGITSDKQLTDLYNQATKAPVESKRPTLQDALDGKSTKIAPQVGKTEPKIPKVAPKRTETAPKKAFIPPKKPKRPTEADWQSIEENMPAGVLPSKGNLLKERAEYNQAIKNSVLNGDFETANKLRNEARGLNTEIKTMTQEAKDKIPDVAQPELDKIFQPRDIKDKRVRKDFEAAAKEYLGATKSAAFERQSTIADLNNRYNLSEEEKLNAILSIDDSSNAPMNQKVAQYVKEFRDSTDVAYENYTNQGVKMGFQSEYLPRIYKNPVTGEAISGDQYRLLQQGSARQRGREAELLNPDALIYKDPNKLLDSYYRSMDEAIAGKRFLKQMEESGLVVSSSDPVRGLRPVIAEGMQPGDGMVYYAPKEVATKLNRLFGTQESADFVDKFLSGGAKLNSVVLSFVLSGGVPNTPLNSFGLMQVMKEAMALHPIRAGKAFFGAGLSKSQANKMFAKRKDIMKIMAENDVAPRVDLEKLAKSGRQRIVDAGDKGTLHQLNQAWDELTNDATFGRFMPMLEVTHFEQVYNKALNGGITGLGKKRTPQEAGRIAAESVKNFYGRPSDFKTSVRSKKVQDAAGTFLFAPRFRESMVNFWIKNAKAAVPTNYGKMEYRDNQKFLVASALMWVGMNALNEALNGVSMGDNPDDKKDKLIIPADKLKQVGINTKGKDVAVPFLPSIATIPRALWGIGKGIANVDPTAVTKNVAAFGSMPVQTIGRIAANEDYFGNPIVEEGSTPAERAAQIAAYAVKNNMQPWLREGLNIAGQGLPEDVKKSLGIKEKGAFETIANATESPLRFYNPQYYRYDDSWTPKGGKDEKFTITEQRERAGIKNQIDGIPDELGLNKRQRADLESLSAVEFNDDGTLKEDSNPYYKVQKYSKLQDDGVFEAMRVKAELNAKLNGKPVDPIFALDGEARRLVLWKKTLPPGTTDDSVKKIYEQDWYQDFRDQESAYYNAKIAWNDKMGYANVDKEDDYPQATPEVQDAMDYYSNLPKGTGDRSAYIRNNPDLWNQMVGYWDKKDAWTNNERGKLGLGNIDEYESTYSSGGGKGRSGRGSSRGSSGGSSGSRKGKFDYKFGAFAPSEIGSKKSLRKILEEAQL